MPDNLPFEKASLACIVDTVWVGIAARGITRCDRSPWLGLGIIGQFALRCAQGAGCNPVVGIDAIAMRRDAAKAAGASHVIDPNAGDTLKQLSDFSLARAARRSSSMPRVSLMRFPWPCR